MWYDVRKKLPSKEGRYLVLTKFSYSGKTGLSHNICFFSKDLYKIDDVDFCDKKGKNGWYSYDSEVGYYEWNNVVYWTELPPLPGKEKAEPEIPQQFIEISELLSNNPSVAKGLANFLMEFSNEKN